METEYIIDCAGNKVAVGDKLFSHKCWVGNCNDYLEANSSFIIPSLVDCLKIPKVSILVPIYRAGKTFLPTVESICSQEWDQPTSIELILYVNQPQGETEEFTKESISIANEFIALNNNNTKTPQVKVVFEKLSGGLGEVYQRSFSTLVARIHKSVENSNLENKDDKVTAIGQLMTSTVFAIIDDDLILRDSNSLPTAIDMMVAGETVVTGQVEITKAVTSYPKWDNCLVNIMNLFFKLKEELGSNILTPRAAIVSDLFHLPPVKIGEDYADQIWFAAAASNKKRLTVGVETNLVEEIYPSNAQMAAQLAHFLETGENSKSLDIFRNLKEPYKTSCKKLRYSFEDLNSFISILEGRNIEDINKHTEILLKKTKQCM